MQNPLKANWLFALAGAVALTSTSPANAGTGQLASATAAAATAGQQTCAAISPAAGASSRASAVLGGQVSQLERMQQQQNGGSLVAPAAALTGAPAGVGARDGCPSFVAGAGRAVFQSGRSRAILNSEDFLASRRLPVKRTSFDTQWARVGHSTVSRGLASEATRAAPGQLSPAMLGAVNSWANQRIRYAEDRKLYGQADFWADAGTTLRRGAGDCEDIALVKLALLSAAGVPRSDMYLTIARDLVRNADHAVLVVKLDGRFYLLDSNTDRLLDARESNDYRPILSYSDQRKWLHGY